MNILVTGAAGFIGSHLIDALLECGHRIVGIDNLSLGKRANLRGALGNPSFTFIECDIAEEPFVETFDPECSIDWVWHMGRTLTFPPASMTPMWISKTLSSLRFAS